MWQTREWLFFEAGRPHCSPVRFDFAVHRAQTTLPPAVTSKSVISPTFAGYSIL